MPPKNFSNSINPELYERSQQPASTIAMGMKSSQASSLAWQDQVRREQTLQERWAAAYDPAASQETRKEEALQHTLTRQAERREQYQGVETNPELHEILYQEDLEELQRQAACTANNGTMNGGKTVSFNATNNTGRPRAAAAPGTQQKPLPPATGPIPYHDGSARTDDPCAHHKNKKHDEDKDVAKKTKYKTKTEEYLTVRADTRTMPERFPQGPRTGSQALGWQAYHTEKDQGLVDDTAHSAMYQTAKARQSKGPYRRPEDATHAQLMGYDLEEK